MSVIETPSFKPPSVFADVNMSLVNGYAYDGPRWPAVTVEDEIRGYLDHYFRNQIATADLLRAMSAYATGYANDREIADNVELHPQKRCGCTCHRWRHETSPKGSVSSYHVHICPRLHPAPGYRTKYVCACGGCKRGHYGSIAGCRWLDYVNPTISIEGSSK